MRFDAVSARWRERDWLIPFAAIIGVQFLFWLVQFGLGQSLMLSFGVYAFLALLTLGIIVSVAILAQVAVLLVQREAKPLRRLMATGVRYRSRLAAAAAAALLIAIGGSAFGASKAAMIVVVPPYADPFLAALDRAVIGQDAWRLFAGFSYLREVDRLYTLWMSVQLLAIFALPLTPPSREKAQALISYALCWFLLGTLAAYAMSSVGPVYYDRMIGGGFAELPRYLQGTDAGRISELLWQATMNDGTDVAEGISAMPSMHVAMTLWLALVLRRTPIAFLAWSYLIVIFVGSIALGWHYASDGLVSIVGVALIWRWSGRLVDAWVARDWAIWRPVPALSSAAPAASPDIERALP